MNSLRAAAKWLLMPALLATLACSTNPATGHSQLNLYSQEQEIALGKQYHQQVLQEIGIYRDDELQSYVDRIGRDLAARSERPDLPWTFTVVDDASVNAFALPGGFVYVTRGLIDHMGSEAELAGVMGHEIGHVAARHSVNQLSKQQLTQLGLTVGMIFAPGAQRYGDLANLAGGLMFLKFSRDDERQADELGLRYITRATYPPQAMGNVFRLLSRVSRTEQGGRLPNWLATHPDPEQRLHAMEAAYTKLPAGAGGEDWRREPLLRQVEGVVYGADPREGFFRDGIFYQPEMGLSVTAPRGWKGVNQRQAVVWKPRNNDAIFALTLANAPSARAAAQQFFSQQGVSELGQWPGQPGGGIGAQFSANTQQGLLVGAVTFVEDGGKVYELLGFAPQGTFRAYADEIARAMASFRRVGPREVGPVEPWRIDVVRLSEPMTLREADRRYPSTVSLDKVALLNNADLDTRFAAGDELKRVVGGVQGAQLD
jgi:predicted Zn-dependent protease